MSTPSPFSSSPFGTSIQPEATAEVTVETGVDEGGVTVETAPFAEVAAETAGKKAKKERTRVNNRRKTPEEVKFIISNFKDMRTSEIANKLGLTPQQVARTVIDARKEWMEKAEQMGPEKAEMVRNWIETNLPSKKEDFGKGGKRGTMVDDMFNEFFAELL